VPGILRHWAKGSLGAIIFMLAACAREFDVVDDVGQALGFPPKVEARKAETCIYIVGRLRTFLARAKWARSETQRQEYHVVEKWKYDPLDKQKETHSYLPLAEGVSPRTHIHP
jgi:hypothetical protein